MKSVKACNTLFSQRESDRLLRFHLKASADRRYTLGKELGYAVVYHASEAKLRELLERGADPFMLDNDAFESLFSRSRLSAALRLRRFDLPFARYSEKWIRCFETAEQLVKIDRQLKMNRVEQLAKNTRVQLLVAHGCRDLQILKKYEREDEVLV